MLKRLITILLLLSFGGLPATAHACNIVSLICQTLEQDEESCCTAEGECKLTMPQMSHCQVETNSQNECLCAINAAKHPDGIIASAPLLPALDDSLKIFLPIVSSPENTQIILSLRSTPHHKSNKTYLKNTCLRL
jgi:hypothetical protein